LHGTDITLVGNHPFYKPAVSFSINKSDVVTSVSQSLKDETYKLFNITKEIEVIPNFIELEKTKLEEGATCYRSLMASDSEKIITHISNFRKVKRIPDIIKIFHKIQQQIPSKLMMVGDGPEKEKAELLCEELGIANKVIFFGNSNEIDKILCFSDLFLLPSETESFGLAALEAMACSVPVISSNTGGLPEVNVDGFSGYLSNVGDIDSMAKNAVRILENETNLAKFKKNAYAVSERFDIAKILPLYEAIYEKAIQEQFKTESN
jgi:N-acetyl-alpha-D-glucosaminyl L-malate synthase BshA